MSLISTEEFASALKDARFEKGKPADPTKNMSPEDAKEWEKQNEENRDNFKSAALNAAEAVKQISGLSDRMAMLLTEIYSVPPAKRIDPNLARLQKQMEKYPPSEGARSLSYLMIPIANLESKLYWVSFSVRGDLSQVQVQLQSKLPKSSAKTWTLPLDSGTWNSLEGKIQGAVGRVAAKEEEKPFEVAYRLPGETWKRKTFKSQAAYEKWYDKTNEEKGIEEVRFREASASRAAENLPPDVERYVKEVKEKSPDYSDEKVWATAWSIYCRANPNSDHCHQNSYFKAAGTVSVSEFESELRGASETQADEKEGKFEKGKPADPTKNMSPEDAKEWEKQNEENRDNFKSASSELLSVSEFENALKSASGDSEEEAGTPKCASRGILSFGMMERMQLLSAFQVLSMGTPKAMGVSRKDAIAAIEKVTGKTVSDNAKPVGKTLDEYLDWLDKEGGDKTAASGLKPSPGMTLVNKENPSWGKWKVLKKAPGTSSSWEIRGPRGERILDEGELEEWEEESGKKASEEETREAGWKGWTEEMPVQVAQEGKPTEVYDNLAEAKKKHPGLNPDKGGGGFYGAMRGEVKGKPAIRFESHAYYQNMKSAASGLYGFTKEAERVCGSATKRLSRFGERLAKEIYSKDAETPAFLEEHSKRTGSRAARMLRGCMSSIGPGQPEKTAARREGGRYGFSAKTSKLALQACLDLETEAGNIAYDLNSRLGSKHAVLTAFLSKHAKKAKCGWSEMIQEAYPSAPASVTASVRPSVSEILAWDGTREGASRSAGSFLASDEGDEEEEKTAASTTILWKPAKNEDEAEFQEMMDAKAKKGTLTEKDREKILSKGGKFKE